MKIVVEGQSGEVVNERLGMMLQGDLRELNIEHGEVCYQVHTCKHEK